MGYLKKRMRRARRGMGATAIEYTPSIVLPPTPPPRPSTGQITGAVTRYRPRAMAGLSSRPFGPDVHRTALGSIWSDLFGTSTVGTVKRVTSDIINRDIHKKQTSHGENLNGYDPRLPRWYTAMYGSLGDDTAGGAPVLTDGTQQWQGQMLATAQQIVDLQAAQVEKDKWIRYAQIAATLSIPLAAAVWKMIFRGGSQ